MQLGIPTSLRSAILCEKLVFRLSPLTFYSVSLYRSHTLLTTMAITSKNERFKGEINGILNNKNYEYEFNFSNRHIKQS